MDKNSMRVLKKLYMHTNGIYDREREVMIYQTDTLTPAEQDVLITNSWAANDLEMIRHNDIIQQLITLQQHSRLSWSTVTQAFIAGVGGSYPRGISTLASYHLMIHLQPHAYEEADRFLACKVCGFSHSDESWKNLSNIRYALHQGYDYSGTSVGAYADLTELIVLLEQGPVTPTDEDITTFNQLLHMLDQAGDEESPGKFEKRLTAEKLVKGHAGIRRSILQALSRTGVLPNQVLSLSPDHWTNNEDILNGELLLNNTKGRSDMEMPWAGWQGKLGVNWDITRKLFGDVIQFKG
ncbi:hypothetical protein JNUCC31_01865 [Paenibacillus sp. JNUCC31]|uniref:hypothetical protein n=1 Tax=Paenibacillus sp. JNUCC-31 TaxID=2777983 RepID=UPI001781E31A|nr:hypothetical protein [Paenibacillus sp. JNUCC-31]QOS79724.1 hypothetical protein JNUCC31_01865 [Paenibacillus sp. JNUCC-31]